MSEKGNIRERKTSGRNVERKKQANKQKATKPRNDRKTDKRKDRIFFLKKEEK